MLRKFYLILIFLFFSLSCAQSLQDFSLQPQIRDKNGKTLAEAFKKEYREKITIKSGCCYFYESQTKGEKIEYEIENCRLKYSTQKVASKFERQQGLELRGKIWFEGDYFRMRPQNGTWSKRTPSKRLRGKSWKYKTGYDFIKWNGDFVFTPTIGALKIQRNGNPINEPKIATKGKKDNNFFLIIPFIIFVLIIVIRVYLRRTVGSRGEKYTAKRIKAVSGGIVFRDIYIDGSHGVQQIDIIAVTEKGVLVVEKKTYSGLIVGGAYDNQWGVYYYGRQAYAMKNPHHQNYGHVQALKERLPGLRDKIVSLVIFGDGAVLGDNVPMGRTICDRDFDYFYSFLPTILNERQIEHIANDIASIDNNRKWLKEMHKEKIKRFNGEW